METQLSDQELLAVGGPGPGCFQVLSLDLPFPNLLPSLSHPLLKTVRCPLQAPS